MDDGQSRQIKHYTASQKTETKKGKTRITVQTVQIDKWTLPFRRKAQGGTQATVIKAETASRTSVRYFSYKLVSSIKKLYLTPFYCSKIVVLYD